jgi:hypothetical protein
MTITRLSIILCCLLWAAPLHAAPRKSINVATLGACNNTPRDRVVLNAAIAEMSIADGGDIYIPAGYKCVINKQPLRADRPLWIHGDGPSSVITGNANPLIAPDELSEHTLDLRTLKIMPTAANRILSVRKISFTTSASVTLLDVTITTAACTGELIYVEGGAVSIKQSRVSGNAFCPTKQMAALFINQLGDTYAQGYDIFDNWFGELGAVVKDRGENWPLNSGIRFLNNTVLFVDIPLDIENHNAILVINNMMDQVGLPMKLKNVSPCQVSGNYFGGISTIGQPLISSVSTFGDMRVINNAFARYLAPAAPAIRLVGQLDFAESLNTYGGHLTQPPVEQGQGH